MSIFVLTSLFLLFTPQEPIPISVPQEISQPVEEPTLEEPIPEPKPKPKKTIADLLIEAHNKARQSYNLPPLKQDPELMSYAQKWTEHMAKTSNLRHQSLRGKAMGENIAMGQQSIEEVMNCWMQSSGHRANILRQNFTTIGAGIATGINGMKFWCVDFGMDR